MSLCDTNDYILEKRVGNNLLLGFIEGEKSSLNENTRIRSII